MPRTANLTAPLIFPGLILLGLAACDVRRTGGDEEQPVAEPGPADGAPSDAATPTPTPSVSPVASIIRDDAAPYEANVDLPTQPVEMTITFGDSADLAPAAERQLTQLLTEAALEEEWPVVLRGHSASGGNDEANLRDSRSRAEAVAAWLVENGVADERIEVIAFGEQNPVAPNALPDGSPNEAGRRANRRVEISITPPVNEPDSGPRNPWLYPGA